MKIIIAGASTFGVKNTGDDAMLQVLVSNLKKNISKLQITFLARHPDQKFDKYYGIKSIKNIEFNSNKESSGKRFFGFNPSDSKEHLSKIINEIKNADLVIIGGNSFMEFSPNEFLRGTTSYSSFIATLSILFKTPYVLYGVNGHSLNFDLTKQMASFLCENAKFVGIRDEPFRDELLKLGISSKNLKVFTDPGFGLTPIKKNLLGKKIFKQENIQTSSKIVGICFRRLYSKWSDKKFNDYALKIASLCDFLITTYNYQILFIPNCIYEAGHPDEDDRRISQIIKNKMKEKSNAFIILNDLNVNERLSIFPLLDFVITNRRHVVIFSAIHNIPCLTLGYESTWHFQSLMNDLKLNDYYTDIRNTNLKILKNKTAKLIKSKNLISKSYKKLIPKLQKTALKEVNTISGILK